jgi:hypothetical protein
MLKKNADLQAEFHSFVELERIEDLQEGLLRDLNVVEIDLLLFFILLPDLLQNLIGIRQVGRLGREVLQRRGLNKNPDLKLNE